MINEIIASFPLGKVQLAELQLILSYAYLGSLRSRFVVEVGTWHGKTTRMLSELLLRISPQAIVITIDKMRDISSNKKPNDLTNEALLESGNLIHVFGDSREVARAWTFAPGFVFIDGCHCKECVKADAAAWLPKICAGGYAAFHDVGAQGKIPKKFNVHVGRDNDVSGALKETNFSEFMKTEQKMSLRVYQKKQSATR